MKQFLKIQTTCFGVIVLLLAGLMPLKAQGAGKQVRMKATLIKASNEPAPMDHRLERIEFKLRRIFGFKYYSQLGSGQVMMGLPGEATLNLGKGYSLRINAKRDGKGIRATVQWKKGKKSLLRTSIRVHRGVPTVLGGPSTKGGTLIVTLVAE